MTPDKCVFLKKLAHGVRDLMEYSQRVNTIGSDPQNNIEKFIKKHLLIRIGTVRMTFQLVNLELL